MCISAGAAYTETIWLGEIGALPGSVLFEYYLFYNGCEARGSTVFGTCIKTHGFGADGVNGRCLSKKITTVRNATHPCSHLTTYYLYHLLSLDFRMTAFGASRPECSFEESTDSDYP